MNDEGIRRVFDHHLIGMGGPVQIRDVALDAALDVAEWCVAYAFLQDATTFVFCNGCALRACDPARPLQ